jgi:hypothetical protein
VSNWGQTEQIRELRDTLTAIRSRAARALDQPQWRPVEALIAIEGLAKAALDKDNPTVRE